MSDNTDNTSTSDNTDNRNLAHVYVTETVTYELIVDADKFALLSAEERDAYVADLTSHNVGFTEVYDRSIDAMTISGDTSQLRIDRLPDTTSPEAVGIRIDADTVRAEIEERQLNLGDGDDARLDETVAEAITALDDRLINTYVHEAADNDYFYAEHDNLVSEAIARLTAYVTTRTQTN